MSSARSIPTLDEILANPRLIAEIPAQAASDLRTECDGALVRHQRVRDELLLRTVVAALPVPVNGSVSDVVDLDEAAKLLGRSRGWLYHHAHRLPFTLQERRGCRLRFSRSGIERYLREQLRR